MHDLACFPANESPLYPSRYETIVACVGQPLARGYLYGLVDICMLDGLHCSAAAFKGRVRHGLHGNLLCGGGAVSTH